MASKAAFRPLRSFPSAAAAVFLLAGCQPAVLQPVPVRLTLPYNDAATAETPAGLIPNLADSYVSLRIFDMVKPARGVARRATVNGGSGTIVDRRGYIVTTAHIAKDPRFLAEVISTDGRRHAGRVIAVSPDQDLALVKVAPLDELRAAVPADKERLAAGDTLVSIGTPDGKMGVVTVGTVLETRRAARVEYAEYGYDDAIVLRMTVAPGHSGGPLFNTAGELVGLIASFGLGDTTRKPYVPTEIAFAIPSSKILAFLERHRPP